MVMLVPRAKITTSNSIIWLKHSMGLLGCYNTQAESAWIVIFCPDEPRESCKSGPYAFLEGHMIGTFSWD